MYFYFCYYYCKYVCIRSLIFLFRLFFQRAFELEIYYGKSFSRQIDESSSPALHIKSKPALCDRSHRESRESSSKAASVPKVSVAKVIPIKIAPAPKSVSAKATATVKHNRSAPDLVEPAMILICIKRDAASYSPPQDFRSGAETLELLPSKSKPSLPGPPITPPDALLLAANKQPQQQDNNNL